MLKNMKMKPKLLTCFLIVIALLLIIAGFSIYQLLSLKKTYTYTIDVPVESEMQITELMNYVTDMRRCNATMIMHSGSASETGGEKIEDLYASAQNSYKEIVARIDEFDRLAEIDAELYPDRIAKVREESKKLRAAIETYDQQFLQKTYEACKAGDFDTAMQIVTDGAATAASVSDIATDLKKTSEGSSHDSIDDALKAVNVSLVFIIVISVVAFIVAIAIAFALATAITTPIVALAGFMQNAGTTGDILLSDQDRANIQVFTQAKDEVGEAIAGAAMFVEHVNDVAHKLEIVASGDLTVQVNLRSPKDVMGNSLVHTLKNLNDMFSNIHSASEQVTSGAAQIADGAQALASGSTEQAATLQELSASISDISEKTKENAQRTDNAASLATSIMKNAEKGSKQMEQMISAVDDINHANQSISKVIKAIDDIAFQTNILALNAAVEAARAGAAGKGFAVVAEEVRNLAAKSAESAKDTGSLIANSMEKAQLGTQIAGETAASLNDIVAGITESTKIIEEIAASSSEQTDSIHQINSAIGGVTQVVQQNSATAEESAAASEEMSGQANMLESLVSQFKIKM